LSHCISPNSSRLTHRKSIFSVSAPLYRVSIRIRPWDIERTEAASPAEKMLGNPRPKSVRLYSIPRGNKSETVLRYKGRARSLEDSEGKSNELYLR
jgi:hypothetical protein